MENNIEQPILEENNEEILNHETENQTCGNQTEISLGSNFQDGSMIGKFKDAKTLLSAYNNLQSEFTRKCQKLSELEKNSPKQQETENVKQFETLDDFVSSNTDSDKYKKEITEILSNSEIDNLPNKYQVAYLIAKMSESEIAKRLNNPENLDKVVETNPKIKEKIISNYLSTISNLQSAPSIMSGSPTGIYFSNTDGKPKTIKEAGELLSKMLK